MKEMTLELYTELREDIELKWRNARADLREYSSKEDTNMVEFYALRESFKQVSKSYFDLENRTPWNIKKSYIESWIQ